MALAWRNVGKYDFLTGEDVLAETGLLKKAAQSKDLDIHH